MASESSVIAVYESLLRRSEQMLDFARLGDWSSLVMERSLYLVDLERVTQHEKHAQMSEGDRLRRICLLEGILERDAEIRACLVARRDELGRLLSVSRRQLDLNRAYGDGACSGPGRGGV
jgi:flagellar protein FliT